MTAIQRMAMLSVHTSPLATLGGKKAGGMNVYVRDLSRELGRRGFEVDVFTRRQASETAAVVSFGENARVIHIPAGPPIPLSSETIYPHLPEFVEGVHKFAKTITYDVIFSHYWLSGWVAHELRARWSVPVIQMFHTLGRMKNRIAQDTAQQETDIRIFTETDIMSWADRLIAATPAERAQMLWLYRADRRAIEIIPPGVDLDRFQPLPKPEAKAQIGLHPDKRFVLFVGRIEPLKGVDTLLHATAHLRDKSPDLLDNLVIFIIGGDPENVPHDAELARLQALSQHLSLHNNVRFLGARDQDTLPYYYSAAETLVMPSDYESFGMVALEAMACGTPVIASEIGGLAFLVQDGVTGFHVPTRDPVLLADKIRLILSDSKQTSRMGETARQMAQNYSWTLIADQLLDVFEAVRQRRSVNVLSLHKN